MSEPRYRHALDVGYSAGDTSRFKALEGLEFGSVLDVGSGPCLLHGWLRSTGRVAGYEAFDIRRDALALCDCFVHHAFPSGRRYDLVCLFGTTGYDDAFDPDRSKSEYIELLRLSAASASKYLVFTLMKDFEENRLLGCRNTRGILHYKNREAAEVAMSLGMSFFTTAVGHEPTEHLFICHR
jgi:hypothetical protein